MDEEERKMLRDVHDALFAVPIGSPSDREPLIIRANAALDKLDRGSWTVRTLIWLLPVLAGMGIAFKEITGWIK